MMSRIPSWAVAIAGALILIVATATSSILLHKTKERTTSIRSELKTLREQKDLFWSSHLLADQRSTAADIFFGQALGVGSNIAFLLGQTAGHLQGAVLAMWAASGEPVPAVPPKKIQSLHNDLRKGNQLLSAYMGLKSEIDRLRLLSQSHVNRLSSDIDAKESVIQSLESRETSIYLAHIFFNLLGFIVTVCKDLPVWRNQQRS